jgi:hypothetical protein
MPGTERVAFFTAGLLLCGMMGGGSPPAARAHHRARLDPTEPIFTQRSFVEKNLELDSGWAHGGAGDSLEFSPGASWVFGQRLEIDLEVPVGVQFPSPGAAVGSLGDIGAGVQVLLCCQPNQLLDYFSLRAEVAAPTGSRGKAIGGTGAWSAALLPGRLFTIAERLPDLFVQAQVAYAEQLRPDDEARAAAADAGASAPREKEVQWNIAFAQQYLAGRLRPVFEVLGTSIVDAAAGGEGTIVELAAGLWVAPFADDQWLSPVSLGLGWKWPVTAHRDSDVAGLLILEWSFGN